MNNQKDNNRLQFKYVDGSDKDFIQLCHGLDDFLNNLVGGEENRAQDIPYNLLADIHKVIVAYDQDTPIGCAAFKRYDETHAEVKRVYVCAEYRGMGIAKKLMELLENLAKEQGYTGFVLETGEPLAAAMKLYRSIGYQVIPNFGQYKDMPESVCMKKMLCERN